MTNTAEQPTPPKEPKHGHIDTQHTLAPGLARVMVEAMEAADLIDVPALNWVADPNTRTITFTAPGVIE